MKTTAIVTALSIFATVAWGEAYMGEPAKRTCTALKGQTYASYIKSVTSSSKYEATIDDKSACGKSVLVMKKEGRKRWAVFPDQKGCECYINLAKAFDGGQQNMDPSPREKTPGKSR